MVKSGSFRPGKSGPSAPSPRRGANGPSGRDPKNGTPHPNVGTNRGGSTSGDDRSNMTQWQPGKGPD